MLKEEDQRGCETPPADKYPVPGRRENRRSPRIPAWLGPDGRRPCRDQCHGWNRDAGQCPDNGQSPPSRISKSVCTHCSVGCSVVAEVQNGVWIGQEPGWDSPFNLGAHCAKGASVREHAHGERRLKYPMKKEGGEWKRISWEEAINEIGDGMTSIREESGPDSVYWLGSAKYNNEQAYLFRKFAAYWGTNNVDHQARICHSTTVAGVANTWGYGAMTNSYNDIHNSTRNLHHRRQPGPRRTPSRCCTYLARKRAEQRPSDCL